MFFFKSLNLNLRTWNFFHPFTHLKYQHFERYRKGPNLKTNFDTKEIKDLDIYPNIIEFDICKCSKFETYVIFEPTQHWSIHHIKTWPIICNVKLIGFNKWKFSLKELGWFSIFEWDFTFSNGIFHLWVKCYICVTIFMLFEAHRLGFMKI
jgi:hypothetical protein